MRSLFVVLISLSLIGCGYSFSLLSPSVHSIYISPVQNRIKITSDYSSLDDIKKYYPNLEVFVRQKVIERFLVEGRLKVVDRPTADVQVKITLFDYTREPVGYDRDETVKRWRIRIGARVEVIYPERKVSRTIFGEAIYDPAIRGERFAVKSVAEDLAHRISDLVLNPW